MTIKLKRKRPAGTVKPKVRLKKKGTSAAEEVAEDYEEQFDEDNPNQVQPRIVDKNKLIPSPSTTFNLECSGYVEGAFLEGTIVNLIGDSHSGKTLFALSTLAECAILKRFDEWDLHYDDVEAACEFDIPYLFGRATADRIIQEHRSRTFEQFSDRVAFLLDKGEPFIYVLDSFDALTTNAAIKHDLKNRKKREKGQEEDGSYGDGKPKLASEFFSLRTQDISDCKALIIIISQTRDNIGFGSQFNPKTRSGGRALKFYSFHEIWLACQAVEKVKKRKVLTNVQAKITKNKLNGSHGEALFPVLFDYGVDDIAGCIKFLIEDGDWTGTKASINTKGFCPLEKMTKQNKKKKTGVSYTALVDYIEQNDLEKELQSVCQGTFDDIIESIKPKGRKRKYQT